MVYAASQEGERTEGSPEPVLPSFQRLCPFTLAGCSQTTLQPCLGPGGPRPFNLSTCGWHGWAVGEKHTHTHIMRSLGHALLLRTFAWLWAWAEGQPSLVQLLTTPCKVSEGHD